MKLWTWQSLPIRQVVPFQDFLIKTTPMSAQDMAKQYEMYADHQREQEKLKQQQDKKIKEAFKQQGSSQTKTPPEKQQ